MTGFARRLALGTAAVALAGSAFVAAPVTRAAGSTVSVIVREAPGASIDQAALLASLGGRVTNRLDIINGFSARIPSGSLAQLAATPGVAEVTPDAAGHLLSTYDPTSDTASMLMTESRIGARTMWGAGYTGQGVDVALIDSGVVPVNGLTAPGKIINGPDFSLESPATNLRYLDTFGHGTHMAGIIAGRDDAATGSYAQDSGDFIGMAPDAGIVSLKVADSQGNTYVSQILAAIDWVVLHRNDNGMNIRVLNLSFGSKATQPYTTDPLAYAAEAAWHAGIFVVAAAGNDGAGSTLSDPAYDPNILAVGAAASPSTLTQLLSQDLVAAFTNQPAAGRHVDLVAPGTHLQGLRDPGSYIDQTYGSTGDIDSRFFRGSGTSQATAVVSGAAALLIQEHPSITPDQLKALLTTTATPIVGASVAEGGSELNLTAALASPVPSAAPASAPATGGRGDQNSVDSSWLAGDWSASSWAGPAWHAGWYDRVSTSGSWNSASWSSHSWSSSGWNSASWSSASWSSASWSSGSWSSGSWSSGSWSSGSWSSGSWSSSTYSSSSWSAAAWQ